MSYDLEIAIEGAVYCLMHYGYAYIYINAEYEKSENEPENALSVLTSLQIGEIRGLITQRTFDNIEFWGIGPIGSIHRNNYNPSGLVEMSLKDLGYSKTHFSKVAKRLDKYDTTASDLIYNNNDGYDFSEHLRKNTIKEFKTSRELGWISHFDELSESQYLYRIIKQNKLKISMMKYVVDSINKSLQSFIDLDSDGRVSINLNDIDYDKLWKKYSEGKITAAEFSTIIK